jgi:hypothetical protein
MVVTFRGGGFSGLRSSAHSRSRTPSNEFSIFLRNPFGRRRLDVGGTPFGASIVQLFGNVGMDRQYFGRTRVTETLGELSTAL